jgi:hypothetical protein
MAASASASASYRMSTGALARLFRSALGEEKATEIVIAALGELRLPAASGFDQGDALKILEVIAKTPGIVGITARFAKSHVHLHWGDER